MGWLPKNLRDGFLLPVVDLYTHSCCIASPRQGSLLAGPPVTYSCCHKEPRLGAPGWLKVAHTPAPAPCAPPRLQEWRPWCTTRRASGEEKERKEEYGRGAPPGWDERMDPALITRPAKALAPESPPGSVHVLPVSPCAGRSPQDRPTPTSRSGVIALRGSGGCPEERCQIHGNKLLSHLWLLQAPAARHRVLRRHSPRVHLLHRLCVLAGHVHPGCGRPLCRGGWRGGRVGGGTPSCTRQQ